MAVEVAPNVRPLFNCSSAIWHWNDVLPDILSGKKKTKKKKKNRYNFAAGLFQMRKMQTEIAQDVAFLGQQRQSKGRVTMCLYLGGVGEAFGSTFGQQGIRATGLSGYGNCSAYSGIYIFLFWAMNMFLKKI